MNMKEIINQWNTFLQENIDNTPLLSGNCGTFAVALAKEAIKRKIDNAGIVFVHNAETDKELFYGDYSLYHVAFFIGDDLYDARGKIEEENLTDVDPNIPEDAYVDLFDLKNLDGLERAIKKNTEWDIDSVDLEKKAQDFFNETIETK